MSFTPQKILVIRFKRIGDVLLTSTLCSSLRKSFPEAQIDYLVYAASVPILSHHPAIDNVIGLSPAQTSNPFRYLATIWGLSRSGYDIIIDASSTGKSELISLLSRGARYRIGRSKSGRGVAYTHSVDKVHVDKIEQRLSMLQPLIDDGLAIQFDKVMRVTLTDAERCQASALFAQHGVDPAKPVFAFSVSSMLSWRMWKPEYMRAVAEHCLAEHGAQIVVLTGLPHEQATIDAFRESLNAYPAVFNNIDTPGLRKLAAVIAQCDLFVGNEGGPRHIAEALGVPSVAVCSPSIDKGEWLPDSGPQHLSVDWRDVTQFEQEPEFGSGDDVYFELYYAIQPAHVIALVDQVLALKSGAAQDERLE